MPSDDVILREITKFLTVKDNGVEKVQDSSRLAPVSPCLLSQGQCPATALGSRSLSVGLGLSAA